MVNIKKTRVIKGDPKKIWELISQVECYPEWLPDVLEARVTTRPNDGMTELGRQQVLKSDTALGKVETLQQVIVWEHDSAGCWYAQCWAPRCRAESCS